MRYHPTNLFTISLLLMCSSSLYRAFAMTSSSSADTLNSNSTSDMKDLEKCLAQDFPEATSAEIARFVAAYGKPKGNADRIKKGEEALVSSKYVVCSI
jgi:hypothetical protein